MAPVEGKFGLFVAEQGGRLKCILVVTVGTSWFERVLMIIGVAGCTLLAQPQIGIPFLFDCRG